MGICGRMSGDSFRLREREEGTRGAQVGGAQPQQLRGQALSAQTNIRGWSFRPLSSRISAPGMQCNCRSTSSGSTSIRSIEGLQIQQGWMEEYVLLLCKSGIDTVWGKPVLVMRCDEMVQRESREMYKRRYKPGSPTQQHRLESRAPQETQLGVWSSDRGIKT